MQKTAKNNLFFTTKKPPLSEKLTRKVKKMKNPKLTKITNLTKYEQKLISNFREKFELIFYENTDYIIEEEYQALRLYLKYKYLLHPGTHTRASCQGVNQVKQE